MLTLVLTVNERELINEYANRSDRVNNTRTMVCGDMDGTEKWFSDKTENFEVSEDLYIRTKMALGCYN